MLLMSYNKSTKSFAKYCKVFSLLEIIKAGVDDSDKVYN
ncbi:hypothetical protein H376_1670 [Rickettsia prowazekii str. GvF12]|nr:hypothetical protein H374_4210 [Rickettsia prowazekii str. NMRC Madrid E]EOB10640.1 hypothetical protein H376_1670 [Rickettsia prowazekii str. GvF12]EOB10816.1 hypothetical protein H377_3090 [Rickettsia prowazekii str. Cairo 3]